MRMTQQHRLADDGVRRTRARYREALRSGMGIAEASAYANGLKPAEHLISVGAPVELAGAGSTSDDSSDSQLDLSGGSGSVVSAAPPAPKPSLSACAETMAHIGKADAEPLAHHPPNLVFQALLA